MMRAIVAAFVAALLLSGCNGGPEYTIDAGAHYSGTHFALEAPSDAAAYEVMFYPDCLYRLKGEDRYDWNKLCGRSYGLFSDNWSIRLGWRCTDSMNIELTPYLHVDGAIVIARTIAIPPGEIAPQAPVCVSVGAHYIVGWQRSGPDIEFFCRSDETGERWRGRTTSIDYLHFTGYGYSKYPYFGGTSVCPHRMHIYMKQIQFSPQMLN